MFLNILKIIEFGYTINVIKWVIIKIFCKFYSFIVWGHPITTPESCIADVPLWHNLVQSIHDSLFEKVYKETLYCSKS